MFTQMNRSALLVAALLIVTSLPVVAEDSEILDDSVKVETLDDTAKLEIRKEEEDRARKSDENHQLKLQAMIDQYERIAEAVAGQGGDPTPLLQAVEYYQNQLK